MEAETESEEEQSSNDEEFEVQSEDPKSDISDDLERDFRENNEQHTSDEFGETFSDLIGEQPPLSPIIRSSAEEAAASRALRASASIAKKEAATTSDIDNQLSQIDHAKTEEKRAK